MTRANPAPATPAPSLLARLRPARIVVLRALQLGDMLCAVPALRALRGACADAHITLVGLPWAAAFARRYRRYVDDFVAFPGFPGFPEREADIAAFPAFLTALQARRFDLALQLHGDGRLSNAVTQLFGARVTAGFGTGMDEHTLPYPAAGSEIHRLLALTDFIGAARAGDALEFPLDPADEAELAASGVARGLAPGRYICLHAGARQADKRWAPERFAAVGDALHAATGLPLVLTGSEAETDITRAVRAALRTPAVDAAAPISAGALAALLAGSRLLVCNDTGVAHIAAGLRLPSVVVFRATEMARWAPLDRRLHRAVWTPDHPDDGLSAVLDEAHALLAAPPPAATAPAPA
ncbi:heptosyltransferase [Azoarcus olearius]|uniref:glycosyltransferase family 9 protein n=1 Tax=Azoarcus sp. (strain BH72) TaxID=418699 RepID=UPI0008061EC7|nr:glycosyltransferase family 9 protein [Azoarcus olearius]ANQ84909.1 heptosyltransferase [Azoarcus olearius]